MFNLHFFVFVFKLDQTWQTCLCMCSVEINFSSPAFYSTFDIQRLLFPVFVLWLFELPIVVCCLAGISFLAYLVQRHIRHPGIFKRIDCKANKNWNTKHWHNQVSEENGEAGTCHRHVWLVAKRCSAKKCKGNLLASGPHKRKEIPRRKRFMWRKWYLQMQGTNRNVPEKSFMESPLTKNTQWKFFQLLTLNATTHNIAWWDKPSRYFLNFCPNICASNLGPKIF